MDRQLPIAATDRDRAVAAVARAAAAIADAQERLEASVRAARAHGATWAQIGQATGVSRQAAHERWGHIPRPGCPRATCDCRSHDVTAECACGHGSGRGTRRGS